jgi:hypothetical protein
MKASPLTTDAIHLAVISMDRCICQLADLKSTFWMNTCFLEKSLRRCRLKWMIRSSVWPKIQGVSSYKKRQRSMMDYPSLQAEKDWLVMSGPVFGYILAQLVILFPW